MNTSAFGDITFIISSVEIPLPLDLVRLYENFETTELLSAVDAVDSLRDDLNDGECFRPPELRTNLLKLHELAMAVVNNGSRSQVSKMFDLGMDLDEHDE